MDGYEKIRDAAWQRRLDNHNREKSALVKQIEEQEKKLSEGNFNRSRSFQERVTANLKCALGNMDESVGDKARESYFRYLEGRSGHWPWLTRMMVQGSGVDGENPTSLRNKRRQVAARNSAERHEKFKRRTEEGMQGGLGDGE